MAEAELIRAFYFALPLPDWSWLAALTLAGVTAPGAVPFRHHRGR